MPKGKGTCPLAQSFWKDQVTTVCHVHPAFSSQLKRHVACFNRSVENMTLCSVQSNL